MKKIIILCMLMLWTPITFAGDAMHFRADSSNLYFMFKDYGAEHGNYPASFSVFSEAVPNTEILKKFKVIRWDVGEGRNYHIQLQSVENEAYHVTIDSESYTGPTFNDAVRMGALASHKPATTGTAVVSFTPEQFKAAEAAANIFWTSLKERDLDTIRMSFSNDITDTQTIQFRDEVNDERLVQLENMLGVFTKVLKSTAESRPGREGWIKVYGAFKKADGKIKEGRAYFKLDDGKFKIIKL